jgi:hypothetical protein
VASIAVGLASSAHDGPNSRLAARLVSTESKTGLIRSGLVNLDHFEITAFDLDPCQRSGRHAAANSGPFKMTVVQPR